MAKKRPFLAMAYIAIILVLIALIVCMSGTGITGFAVYGDFNSILSRSTLAIAGPMVIFIILFSVAVVALKRISKE